MSHIIVVFPKRDNAVNIRNVLVRAGMEVSAVCLTGAKVLQYVDNWSDGIVVCGYRLQDMQYMELREALPFSFDMLLVGSPSSSVWNRKNSHSGPTFMEYPISSASATAFRRT